MLKLITLLETIEKERKKDYLFQMAQRHPSNKVPSWREVWKNLLQTDGFKNLYELLFYEMTNHHTEEIKARTNRIRKEIVQKIMEEQKERYDDIVFSYKQLEGKPCWRVITLSKNVDPVRLSQLGTHWSVSSSKAEAHWGKYGSNHPVHATYEGVIDLKAVDWSNTIYSRMDMSLGDEEEEIRFIKHAKIFVRSVKVKPWRIQGVVKDEVLPIGEYRRV